MVTMRDNDQGSEALRNRPDKRFLSLAAIPTSEPGKFLEDFDVCGFEGGRANHADL